MALPSVCLFGSAGSDGNAPAGFVYKLMGRGDSEDNYKLVLGVTNGATASYCMNFSLSSLMGDIEDEFYIRPTAPQLIDWLNDHYGAGEVEAQVQPGGALQLLAEHRDKTSSGEEYKLDIRLPPKAPMQPLADPLRAAWVVQEILFTQNAWGRQLTGQLQECEQRCSLTQQFEDLLDFLATDSKEGGAAGGRGQAAAAPRAAHIVSKRKLQEMEAAAAAAAAPASASAVKAPRPSSQPVAAAGASGAGSPAAPAAGATQAGANGAAAGPQPASTQVTGGASNASGRTWQGPEPGKAKVKARPGGAGRGSGCGATTRVGRGRGR